MQTIKLFENDAYLTACKAKVIEVRDYKGNKGYILDQTVFYPTGGGQPNDTGKMNDFNVVDVINDHDEIIHLVEGDLTVGEEVECNIDFSRRFDHMQQHSGEHIISGVLCDLYHCDNVGFHMGKEEILIDYNTNITEEQVKHAEKLANEAIYKDVAPNIFILDSDIDYRSKKELTGDIRIVEFPGYDRCACCGTHVSSAGAIGMILVTGIDYIKKGTRIHLLCGKRAFDYTKKMLEDSKKVSAQVSCPVGELTNGVTHLLEQANELRGEISVYKNKYIDSIVESLQQEDVFYEDDLLDAAMAKEIMNRVDATIVFIKYNGQFNLFMKDDVSPFMNILRKSFNVKGGGKKNFAQGKIEGNLEDIRKVWNEYHEKVD